jgi:hypothetical protein
MRLRDIAPTDSLPYYRFSNLTSHGGPSASTIAMPVWDTQGQQFMIMQRSFNPDGTIAFDTNFSHFDSYRIGGDFISQYGTRDNGSFNETFFGVTGNDVTPYNGWTDFPATGFLNTAVTSATDRVLGTSWEICGASPPGPVPASPDALNASALQYQLVTAFPFGSVGGTKKVMSTIAANHQSAPVQFPSGGDSGQGHSEIWYFTMPYGPTRWEVWSAAECLRAHDNPNPPACDPAMAAGPDAYATSNQCSCAPKPTETGDCSDGPTTRSIDYMGTTYAFTRVLCRDWSNVVLVPATNPVPIPYWPSPQANLLSNFHFTDVDPAHPSSARTLHWTIGDSLAVASMQSTALFDTTRSGKGPPSGCASGAPVGVRYITLTCTSAPCASIAQDVPIAAYPRVMTSGTFAFGVTARTEAAPPIGSDVPTMPTGALELTLEQVDGNGNVIDGAASASTGATIGPAVAMNVTSTVAATQANLIASVVLSSAYIGSTEALTIDPRTAALRLRITPQAPGITFDIVDASLARVGPP